jgi:hypothetical protein
VPDSAANVVDVLRPATAGAGEPTTLPAEPARTIAVAGGPTAVAITFDGAYGFVAARATGALVVLDAPSHHALATLDVGGHPQGIITGAYPPALGPQAALDVGIALYSALGLAVVVVIGFVLGWHHRVGSALRAHGKVRGGSVRT